MLPIDELESRLRDVRGYLSNIEDELENMRAMDKKWRDRKQEAKFECFALQKELNDIFEAFIKTPHKNYSFASSPLDIETGVESCPKCGCELEFRTAFFQNDKTHVKIGSFLYCERCKQYYDVLKSVKEDNPRKKYSPIINLILKPEKIEYLDGEYMFIKCKNPNCNRPAWHNGFCFMCWKHENYEVK